MVRLVRTAVLAAMFASATVTKAAFEECEARRLV